MRSRSGAFLRSPALAMVSISPSSLDAEEALPLNPDGLRDARLSVRIKEEGNRHIGFDLCPARGETCLGFFYSAALYDDWIAWWAYPLAPFAIAIDISLLPIQVLTLPPLLAISD